MHESPQGSRSRKRSVVSLQRDLEENQERSASPMRLVDARVIRDLEVANEAQYLSDVISARKTKNNENKSRVSNLNKSGHSISGAT